MTKSPKARHLPPDRIVARREVEGRVGDLRWAAGVAVRTLDPTGDAGPSAELRTLPRLPGRERGTPREIQRWETEGGAVVGPPDPGA